MKKCWSLLLALVLLLSMAVPSMAAQKKEAPTLTSHADIVYDKTRSKNNTYDLFVPETLDKSKPVNIVMCLHSGSWTSGDKMEMSSHCGRFTELGYVAASLNYRIYDTNNITKKQANYAWTITDIMTDIALTLNNIATRLEQAGYTVGNAALFGYSAGGHLAMLYAYGTPNSAKVPVVLVMEQSGPVDFHADAWEGSAMGSDVIMRMVVSMANRSLTMDEASIDAVSPAGMAKIRAVPTVAIYGGKDDVIGTGHKDILEKALKLSRVEYEVLLDENANHIMDSHSDNMVQFYKTCADYCAKYLDGEVVENGTVTPAPARKKLPVWGIVLIVLAALVVLSGILWILIAKKVFKKLKEKVKSKKQD